MLTETQIDTLIAVVNRVIPPDEFPGGWDAGVGEYLFRQFQRDLKHMLPMYRQWLDGLEAEAQAVHSMSFHMLNSEVQDALLVRIEQGQLSATWDAAVDPAALFQTIAVHCAEGYYADPGNGGNKDMIAWKMIGYDTKG